MTFLLLLGTLSPSRYTRLSLKITELSVALPHFISTKSLFLYRTFIPGSSTFTSAWLFDPDWKLIIIAFCGTELLSGPELWLQLSPLYWISCNMYQDKILVVLAKQNIFKLAVLDGQSNHWVGIWTPSNSNNLDNWRNYLNVLLWKDETYFDLFLFPHFA